MSILSKIWSDILAVVYPPKCLVCGQILHVAGTHICTKCFGSISYTRYWEHADNIMAEHARDMQPMIENACAMLYYDSYSRPMIHRLKYYKEWHTAKYLGELLGAYLSVSGDYNTVEVVVPVPIHPIKRIDRNYNQAEYIAQGVASKLGVETNFSSLYRSRYTSAQARKSRVERWSDNDDIFGLRNIEKLRGKHILLVDDVYTSGATIFRCVETLHRAIPQSQISVATLAIPPKF